MLGLILLCCLTATLFFDGGFILETMGCQVNSVVLLRETKIKLLFPYQHSFNALTLVSTYKLLQTLWIILLTFKLH